MFSILASDLLSAIHNRKRPYIEKKTLEAAVTYKIKLSVRRKDRIVGTRIIRSSNNVIHPKMGEIRGATNHISRAVYNATISRHNYHIGMNDMTLVSSIIAADDKPTISNRPPNFWWSPDCSISNAISFHLDIPYYVSVLSDYSDRQYYRQVAGEAQDGYQE